MASTAQFTKLGDSNERSVAPAAHGRAPILYVLSGDDALLLELGPRLGTRYRTRPIDSADQISAPTAAPWALMIDAIARTDARAQAARVKQQFPQAPLLVICADGAAADWASPLARGALAAVVERGALFSEIFEAALEVVDRQMVAAFGDDDTDGSRFVGSTKRRSAWWVVGLALAMAASGTWYLINKNAGPPATDAKTTRSAPPPVVPPAVQAPVPVSTVAPASARTVLELLSDARVAFREGKSLLPSTEAASNGNSALELYAKVLAQDPQNEEARDGLRRLFAVSSARIRADLNAGKEEDAARLLNAFRGVGIDPAAIAKLEAEIVAARPRTLIAQTRTALAKGETDSASHLLAQLAATDADRATIAALQMSLDSQRATARLGELASHARSLIKTGALLDPANDNAQATVLSMQQLNRTSPVTLSAEHELQSALIDRTLTASRAGQFDVAQQLLNAAAILGNSPELTTARNQVQAALDAATRARAATPAAAPPRLPMPPRRILYAPSRSLRST